MKINSLEEAVITTLAYSAIFHFPLTEKELLYRLLFIKTTPAKLEQMLKDLLEKGAIDSNSGYYSLAHSDSHLRSRLLSARRSQKKLARALRLASYISKAPTVLAVYLTGSLAVNNSKADDDIDLMLICRDNTLWTTRFFLTLILDLFNLRRKPKRGNSKDLLCLNIFLTPASLTLPDRDKNIFTAYELIQAKPLFLQKNLSGLLYSQNTWLKKYFPNHQKLSCVSSPQLPRGFFNPLEKLLYQTQLLYMAKNITNETISPNIALFHPRSLSPVIMSKLNQILTGTNK